MSEGIPAQSQKLSAEQKEAAARTLRGWLETGGNATLKESTDSILAGMNLGVRYEQEGNPEFARMRERLRTEPGMLIANHPGGGDIFALANMIERPDAKIAVIPQMYDVLKPVGETINRNYFIRATNNKEKGREVFRELKTPIQSGGLLMLFPTGDVPGEEPEFGNAFRLLIQGVLKPTDMVYTCWIKPETVLSKTELMTVLAKAMYPELAQDQGTKPEKTIISINERYTQAGEWQEVMATVPKDERNTALKDHYLSLFNKSREDL